MNPTPTRAIFAGLCLIALGAGGCYSRTVETRGVGGRTTSVQKSYRSDTSLDRAYDSTFGPAKKQPRTALNRPAPPKKIIDPTSREPSRSAVGDQSKWAESSGGMRAN